VSAADRLGLSPDQVSVIAFLVAVAAAAAFAAGSAPLYAVGALLVLLNGWLDVVDGALARHQGVASDGGDFLDHVLDRYADVAIIAGFTAGIEAYALGFAAVTGVLLTSYLGTQIQAVGIGREYGGLLGRADRLALAGIVGVVAAIYSAPIVAGLNVVGLLLALFAVVGHLTAVQRFLGAWSDL
jgi:archaetidylinositol phosphate synthase